MTESMVERVARAINAEMRRQFDGQPAPGLPHDPHSWTAEGHALDLTLVATAAIEVMSEPTEEMQQAGYEAVDRNCEYNFADQLEINKSQAARDAYRAMISTAAEEGK